VGILVLLHSYPWAIYFGFCAGYTVLVFGLRSIELSSKSTGGGASFIPGVLLTHATFLAIVISWVWLGLVLRPHLPYILTSEDTSHPYFGLGFLGVVGLLLLELVEQRMLRAKDDSAISIANDNATDMNKETLK
jgi:hypothetical protein